MIDDDKNDLLNRLRLTHKVWIQVHRFQEGTGTDSFERNVFDAPLRQRYL